jgi:hypothetical protein
METLLNNTTAQLLSKETLPVESAKSLTPTILIESILPSRNNPNFQGVMFRWHTEKANSSSSSLVSFALGGATTEKRVAVQTFSKDVIAKFKIEAGKNINDILKEAGMPLARISVHEITESDYLGLPSQEQAGYTAKFNPSTGEMLMANGEQIYRKVFFDDVNGTDKYVSSTASSDGPTV